MSLEFLLIKSSHITFLLILCACLFSEWALLEKQLTRNTIKRIAMIDAFYGISAVVVLVSGLYMALEIGKGRDFYFDNIAIYIKLVVFLLVGIISIFPTVFFLKSARGEMNETVAIPAYIINLVKLELALLLCLPFFAVILANGYHLF